MRRDAFTQQDLRQLPAYAISEAAGYLQLPTSTLRSWLLGQRNYDAHRAARFFKPVIDIADSKQKQLSFINLVEAFVLAGIRRDHEVPLPKVRRALDYVRRSFGTRRPLAEEQFETDGADLFVEKYGALVGVSQEGQLQMREMIRDRLKRVRRDLKGLPEKLILFPAAEAGEGRADVVIDPKRSFGRPVLDGLGVRTTVVFERFMAGENVEILARDYAVPAQAVQDAIRCERLAA
jgi:uncharacterized protein (DUF433 family)